jgi:F0F1-type ATP synthase alpha subunit
VIGQKRSTSPIVKTLQDYGADYSIVVAAILAGAAHIAPYAGCVMGVFRQRMPR